MVQNRATERKKQSAEIEEEKEVPSEHPAEMKVTPTKRNGCNATTRPGFSFETMMNLGTKVQN